MNAILLALGPLLGVVVGAVLTSRLTSGRERTTRRHEFVRRQIEDLYAPLVALRKDIRAKSELRLRISQEADAVWRELCAGRSPDQLRDLEQARFPEFENIIQYDNRQLAEALLPDYRRMLHVLKESYWLAEESTREYYGTLLEYVEVWNRSQADSLPVEVLKRLDHSESSLEGFYAEVEQRLEALRDKLAKGAA